MNQRPPLFRPQAMAIGDMGATLGARPLPWRAVAAVLAATLALAVGFSAFAGVSRKETLSGYLQPAGGAVRVVAPRGGVLARLNVAPGQRVAAGTPLFLIESQAGLENGGNLSEAQAAALQGQVSALRRRLVAEQSSAGLEEAQMRTRLGGLRSAEASLAEQLEVQRERVASTQERLRALAPIRAKGYVSEDEYRNREEHLLSLRQGLSEIEGQLAANRREQGEAAISLRKAGPALAQGAASLQSQMAELERQQVEAGAAGALLVRAPVSGRLMALRAEPGQPVAAGAPILTIAPGTPRLRAVLLASQQVVGLIQPGQRVRVMYDAFPVARFGAQAGVVTNISTAAVPADDVQGPTRYRVEVAIEKQSVTAYGKEASLQPDMTLKADIVLEKRSLLEWMLQPLLAARARR